LVGQPPIEDQAVTDAATENARLTQASGGLRLGLLSQVARPDTSMLGPAMASMASWGG